MAQTVIGLDVGTWSIKAVVLESTVRHFGLIKCAEQHIERDPKGELVEHELTGAVRAVLARLGDRDAISTAVPGCQVLTRELELPFSENKKIRSVLGFQLDGQFPLPIDRLVYDYHRLEVSEEGTRLLCLAVERSWLVEFLSELKAAEADPKIVTLDTLANGHLLRHLAEVPDEATVAVIDMGHTTTSVSLVHQGQVKSVRTIARGGHQLTLALMRGLDVDYAAAETIKHTGLRLDGTLPPETDAATHARRVALVERALDDILRDVRLTFHAHTSRWGEAPDRILLFGGTSRLAGIDALVGQSLGVPVTRPRLAEQSWVRTEADAEVETGQPQAISLALRLMDQGVGEAVNFRQGDLAFESDFKVIRDKAGWLLAAAALLLIAFFGHQIIAYHALEKNHAALVAQLDSYTARTLGKKADSFHSVVARLKHPPPDDTVGIFPEMTAFNAFFHVTTAQDSVNHREPPEASAKTAPSAKPTAGKAPGPATPSPPGSGGAVGSSGNDSGSGSGGEDNFYKVELRQIQANTKTIYLKGEANNIEAVEAFTGALKKQVCFKDVKTNDTTRISFGNRQDWLRFQLKIDLSCERPASAGAARVKHGGRGR